MAVGHVNKRRRRWYALPRSPALISKRFERGIMALLAHPATAMLARVALVSPYFLSGLFKLLDFPAAVQESAALGLSDPALVAATTIATQLIGSALFLSHRFCWLGAGILAVFTLIATLIAHSFWRFDGLEQAHEFATFLEHVALIGGLALAAVVVRLRRMSA